MRRAWSIWPLIVVFSVTQALADARMSVLVDVLKLREAAQILSNEGLSYADELNQEMLGGQGGAGWDVQVAAIYDPVRMVEQVRLALQDELSDVQVEDAIAFFASDLGSRIIKLENTARVAIQDPEVEMFARGQYSELKNGNDLRFDQIDAYVEAGDMLNCNVTSALNSNVQFMRGLVDGDMLEMSEEEILSDVGSDLDATHDDTAAWLYGFLLMAYHPLKDAELDAYITFAETDAGQALNRALFAGFGVAYEDISYALGRAVALNITAQEL